MRFTKFLLAAVLSVAASAAFGQSADKYPSHPVKIIVPYGPGGATDIVARILADQLSKSLGQQFYVENKPGAFGMLAIEEMVKSPPDGTTLMIGNVSTNAITPIIYASKMTFDYMKEVVPITNTVDIPAFLVATKKNFDVTTVPQFVDYAKKHPGQVRYGTVGNGSYPHYDMAYFAKRAGDLDMVAIPNKAGASGIINDMLTGSTQVAFLNLASTAPQVKAGSLQPLALVNHARLPDYPDLPTMQELGYPGVGTIAWQALFAPAGVPKDTLQTIFNATVAAMKAPETAEAFKKQTFNIVPNASLADAKTWLAQQMDTWRKITSEVKIEAEWLRLHRIWICHVIQECLEVNKQEVITNPAHPVVFDQDVDVPMRDGAQLKADVFRPYGDGKYPAILNLGPYQKDKLWLVPAALEEKQNDWMNWETVNPEWWVPRGYACVRVDGRGSGKSMGQCEPWSFAEAVDFYDAIEWAAAQPWCNGKVGLLGISYFAINQWFAANLSPPSLKAIIPWEGFADIYRDALYHGGILNLFMTNWFTAHMLHHLLGRASREQPDGWQVNTLHFWLRNNLDSGAFAGAQAQWDKIDVPFFSVGNWSGYALHLRGNTEAFMRATTPHKKLRIHLGSHVHPFYTDEGRQDQIRFLDYWLKGIDNGVMDEPPVKLAIRKGGDAFEWRHEQEWPLKRTRWTKLYLDLSQAQETPLAGQPLTGTLDVKNPPATGSRSYPASSLGTMGSTSAASSQVMGGGIKPGMGVSLETTKLSVDTEITGPLACVLWVSSTAEDMDLFLTLRNIGPDGNEIMETGQQGAPVPVAKGWLRVSHRELDPDLSLPYRPYHKHQRRLYLTPGEIVKVEIEIWPTSMVFKKGHRIRLDIQPRDGVGSAQYMHYHADYNSGAINKIHAGGDKESYLLLPVIPAA